MRTRMLGPVCLGLALLPGASAADDIDRGAVSTATRELGRQVDFLQELFGTNDQLKQIGGLFQQSLDFQSALADFRASLKAKASNEQMAIGFDTLDRKLKAILGEVQFLEKDLPALKLVCNRLRFADHDLHFAVFGGNGSDDRKSEKLIRQTLATQALVESLLNNVNWLFGGREDARAVWKNDVAAVHEALRVLQRVEDKKEATADEIKDHFLAADKSWAKVVQSFTDARPQDKVLLRSFVVMADQGFARLAPLAGVKDRRAPLTGEATD